MWCSQSAAGSWNDSDLKDAHVPALSPTTGTRALLRTSLSEQTVRGLGIFSRFGAFWISGATQSHKSSGAEPLSLSGNIWWVLFARLKVDGGGALLWLRVKDTTFIFLFIYFEKNQLNCLNQKAISGFCFFLVYFLLQTLITIQQLPTNPSNCQKLGNIGKVICEHLSNLSRNGSSSFITSLWPLSILLKRRLIVSAMRIYLL